MSVNNKRSYPCIEARLKELGYLARERQRIIHRAAKGSPKHIEWIRRMYVQRHWRA
jgi:hypothetical protein